MTELKQIENKLKKYNQEQIIKEIEKMDEEKWTNFNTRFRWTI